MNESPPIAGKLAYLTTTFPVLSETFLQREVRALREAGVDLEIHSLWGGGQEFESLPIYGWGQPVVLRPILALPCAAWSCPNGLGEFAQAMWDAELPSLLNGGEVFNGIGFALGRWKRFRKQGGAFWFHATWATMPATAAWLLAKLTRSGFSMGAHAYDLFENGGDWLLGLKLRDAAFVQTSTRAGRERLRRLGVADERILFVRRGLWDFPVVKRPRAERWPLRLLAIGRLVEKKGYGDLLVLLRELRWRGLDFRLRVVGGGPLEGELKGLAALLGVSNRVEWVGAVESDRVKEHHEWADLLVFTGKVTRNGDRDGLPNVIPEAMAAGLPVVATPVGGVTEALADGTTGFVRCIENVTGWQEVLGHLQADTALFLKVQASARLWVEREFDARTNAGRLVDRLGRAAKEKARVARPAP